MHTQTLRPQSFAAHLVAALTATLLTPFSRLRAYLAEEACIDPTANFAATDWADLPTHHPRADEGQPRQFSN